MCSSLPAILRKDSRRFHLNRHARHVVIDARIVRAVRADAVVVNDDDDGVSRFAGKDRLDVMAFSLEVVLGLVGELIDLHSERLVVGGPVLAEILFARRRVTLRDGKRLARDRHGIITRHVFQELLKMARIDTLENGLINVGRIRRVRRAGE